MKTAANNDKVKVWSGAFIQIFLAFTMLKSVTRMQQTFLPVHLENLGASAIVIGLMPTLFSLANISVRPFTGVVIDKKGRYTALLIGMILVAIGTLGSLIAGSIILVLVTRTITGFGNSFGGTTLSTMASDVLPESRLTDGLGYMNLGTTITQAIAPMIILDLYEVSGAIPSLLLIAGFGILALVFSITQKKSCDKIEAERMALFGEEIEAKKKQKVTFKSMIMDMFGSDAWKPSTIIIMVNIANASVNSFLALYAIEKGIERYSLFFTVQAISVAVARFSVGKLSRKLGPVKLLVISLVLNGLSLLGIAASTTLVPLLICAVIFGYVQGAINPQVNTLAVLAAPKSQRGSANATYHLFVDIAGSIGGIFCGFVVQLFGKSAAFIFGGSFAVLGAVLIIVFKKFFVPPTAAERLREIS